MSRGKTGKPKAVDCPVAHAREWTICEDCAKAAVEAAAGAVVTNVEQAPPQKVFVTRKDALPATESAINLIHLMLANAQGVRKATELGAGTFVVNAIDGNFVVQVHGLPDPDMPKGGRP